MQNSYRLSDNISLIASSSSSPVLKREVNRPVATTTTTSQSVDYDYYYYIPSFSIGPILSGLFSHFISSLLLALLILLPVSLLFLIIVIIKGSYKKCPVCGLKNYKIKGEFPMNCVNCGNSLDPSVKKPY